MRLASNFLKLKCIAGLRYYDPLLPFLMIYARHYGLSYLQIFSIQTVFAITIIIVELPSGIFSDIFGRKLSITIGSVLITGSAALFLFYTTFTGFLLAEILYAFAFTLFSGSDNALLFETTKAQNNEQTYLAKEGTIQSYARYAEGLSGITGGILANISIILPAIAVFVCNIPLILFSLSLTEVRRRNPQLQFRQTFKRKLLLQVIAVKRYILSSRQQSVRLLLFFSGLVSAMTITSFWLLQVLMSQQKFSMLTIGVVWLIYFLVTGLCSRLSGKLNQFLKTNIILILLCVLLEVMSLVLGFTHTHYTTPFVLLAAIVFGIKMPFIYNLLNQRLPDNTRASILSFDSLFTRFFFSIMSIVIGLTLDHASINAAYLFLTIPNVIALLLALLFIKGNR